MHDKIRLRANSNVCYNLHDSYLAEHESSTYMDFIALFYFK